MPTAPPRHHAPSIKKRHATTPQDRQKTRFLNTNSVQWKQIRRRILVRDMYRCQDCGKFGNECDHIDGRTENNLDSNLRTLCKPCHSKRTAAVTLFKGRGGVIDVDPSNS